ncbi:MAG: four helix bundle protein [Pseudomonadota bacterium]
MQFNFEKLEVYKDAIEFANRIYETIKAFPKNEIFGVSNQLRRASISIPSDIAEGSTRGKKEFIHFLNIALGSSYECVPLLEISMRQEYINHKSFSDLIEGLHKISAKINALKNSLRK